MRHRSSIVLLLASLSLAPARTSSAQCVEWSSGEFVSPFPHGEVNAMVVFDDGSGRALFAGGSFASAGQFVAHGVARFDGARWAPVGGGLGAVFRGVHVQALAVFDDGSGAALYAGGTFTVGSDRTPRSLARWNGRAWTAVGAETGPSWIEGLAVFDDGSGPALFATAGYSESPGTAAGRLVMKWDGIAWSPIGSPGSSRVHSLIVFDDGTGLALWAATQDLLRGGPGTFRVVRWSGFAWTDVTAGLDAGADALVVHDDGSGPALYAAGRFSQSRLARWDGSAWRMISPSPPGDVSALASFDDGTGRRLAAGGFFSVDGGATLSGAALLDGGSWRLLEGGFSQPVRTLAAFDSGSGPELFAATDQNVPPTPFGTIRGPLSRWDGMRWLPAGPGFDSAPAALRVFDDGRGPAIFAAGRFLQAGSAAARGIARFDGQAWSALGTGLDGGRQAGYALAEFDDGNGPALYVGGDFQAAGGVSARNVARWDGSSFSPLGAGLDAACFALAVYDDGSGPALYAAGDFLTAGGVSARRVARWDGASWSAVGRGTNGWVTTLAAADDGTGPALFAAGSFSRAGDAKARSVAKWDGAAWSSLQGGADGPVNDLAEFDFGSGPRLVAGGAFFAVGGVASPSTAIWDGAAWSPLDPPDSARSVTRLFRVAAPGGAVALFASSGFLARLTAGSWTRLAPDPTGVVTGLVAFDDGFGAALFASGPFTGFGAGASEGFARLSSGDVAPRLGNVNAGRGPIADVLFVGGSAGDAACRRIVVDADSPRRLDVALPPGGGTGEHAFWIFDGTPDPRRPVPARLPLRGGAIVDLGTSSRALPIENSITTGAVRCPSTFPNGVASRRPATPAMARTLCLRGPGGGAPRRAPTSFTLAFPRGTYTIAGVIADPGSANARRVSLTNTVIVEAR